MARHQIEGRKEMQHGERMPQRAMGAAVPNQKRNQHNAINVRYPHQIQPAWLYQFIGRPRPTARKQTNNYKRKASRTKLITYYHHIKPFIYRNQQLKASTYSNNNHYATRSNNPATIDMVLTMWFEFGHSTNCAALVRRGLEDTLTLTKANRIIPVGGRLKPRRKVRVRVHAHGKAHTARTRPHCLLNDTIQPRLGYMSNSSSPRVPRPIHCCRHTCPPRTQCIARVQ